MDSITKTNIGITIVAILLFIITIWQVIESHKTMTQKTISFNQEFLKLNITEQQMHEKFIINLIDSQAQDTALTHEYKLGIFDCTDYSKELISKLQEKGIIAYCAFGRYKGASYPWHTWVIVEVGNQKIPVEATQGYIIDPEEYQNYQLNRVGHCL